MSRHQHPWNVDPCDLRYDEAAGMFTEEEMQVVTVDYSKRRRYLTRDRLFITYELDNRTTKKNFNISLYTPNAKKEQ